MRESKSLAPKPHGGGAPRKADEPVESALKSLVAKEADLTLAEYSQALARELGQEKPLSAPTLCRALQRLKLTRKKSSSTPAKGRRSASRSNGKTGRSK